ncbi:hypothetical protein J9874_04006 (plasmid) [Duffyella gerundensis]|nr:hypothetical protein J9874_04006 [Duffyella gerundensis]
MSLCIILTPHSHHAIQFHKRKMDHFYRRFDH